MDIEASPVNTSQQRPREGDGSDLDVIMIDIFPGVQVASRYHIDEVNLYSQKVIRCATGLCCFQVVVIVFYQAYFGGQRSIIDSLISILLTCLVLLMAVQCVRSKNANCCCGLRLLSFYRFFLLLQLFLVSINIIISIALIVRELWGYVVFLLYYLVVWLLNGLQFRYSSRIMKCLNNQTHPVASTCPNAGNSLSSQYNAVPTVAVVQNQSTLAQAEVDGR